VAEIAIAGRTYPPVTFQIDRERAAAFAKAIGADPAAGVPPTFAAVYSLGVTAPQLFGDEEAAVDFARLLHAEQEFTWSRHPRPDETVTSRGRVASDVAAAACDSSPSKPTPPTRPASRSAARRRSS